MNQEQAIKPTLIAMVGLPRSGKSTIVECLRKQLRCPVVRRDAIRLAVHGERYLAPVEPFIKVLDLYMVKALFLAGHNVVICDETNYSRAARDHMRDPSWETVFYQVPTPPPICCERAVLTNQEDLVPVIMSMADRWEAFLPTDHIMIDLLDDGTIVSMQAGK